MIPLISADWKSYHEDGLVFYAPFENSSSYIDYSGNNITYKSISDIDATDYVSAHVGNGLDLAGYGASEYMFLESNNLLNITQNITICSWLKQPSQATDDIVISKWGASGQRAYALVGNSVSNTLGLNTQNATNNFNTYSSGTIDSSSAFHYLCGVYNMTHTQIYINGTLNTTQAVGTTRTMNNAYTVNTMIGGYSAYGQDYYYSGIIDELGMWNRTLNSTEISDLYNNGDGTTIGGSTPPDATPPTVTLNSPTDSAAETSNPVLFNCSVLDSSGIVNVTLFSNFSGTWGSNETNSSGLNNTFYFFSYNLTNGTYKWNCYSCDILNNCGSSGSNYSFTLNISESSPTEPHYLTNELLVWYDFNEGSNSSLLYDSSPNKINGTGFNIESGDWITGVNGADNAVDITSDNEYFNITNNLLNITTQDLTIGVWAKQANDTDDKIILSKWSRINGQRAYGMSHDPYDNLSFFIQESTSKYQVNQLGGPGNFDPTEWMHLVGTYNDSHLSLYINGVLNNTVNIGSKTLNNNDFALMIGGYSGYQGEVYSWNGTISQVVMYNRSLNSTEISQIYNSGSPLSYGAWSDETAPTVALNSPTGSYNNSNPIGFNCTVTDDVGVLNVTLYSNFSGTWSSNGTDTSGSQGNYLFNRYLDNGTYIWNCYACDTSNNCSFSDTNYSSTLGVVPSYSGSISILYPSQYALSQRDNSTHGTINIYALFTGTPGEIEASFNGGDYFEINASPIGSSFKGSFNGSVGQGTLVVRAVNNNSLNDTVTNFSVGDLFLVSGQSNFEGPQTGSATRNLDSDNPYTATVYREDDAWAIANDPVDSDTTQGSLWTYFLDNITQNLSIPISLITTADGGNSIVNFENPTKTMYHNIINQTDEATNGTRKVKAFLFYQGEYDSRTGDVNGNYENYKGNITSMANFLKGDLDLVSGKIIAGQFNRHPDSNREKQDNIRKAQRDAATENNNITMGVTTYDIYLSSDGIHYKTTAEKQEFARRVWLSVAYQIYGLSGESPRLQKVTYLNSTALKLTFDKELKISDWDDTPAAKAEGWRIHDGATILTDANVGATYIETENLTIHLTTPVSENVNISLGSYNDGNNQNIIRNNYNALTAEMIFNASVTEVSEDTESPKFTLVPNNESIPYGYWSGVDFDASDDLSFDSYSVNDSRFTINSSGFLNTSYRLNVANFLLNISINDSSGNLNSTLYNLTVTKGVLIGQITGSGSYTYPYASNIEGTESNQGDGDVTYKLYRDGIEVSNPENVLLGVGGYTYIYNSTGGQNWTSNSSIVSEALTINQNTSYVLTLIGTSTITYTNPSDFEGSGCPGEISCSLYRNNTGFPISNPDTVGLGAGQYIYTYNTSGNSNYSTNTISDTLTVNKAIPQGSLTTSVSWSIEAGLEVTVGLSESNAGDGDVSYEIWRDGVSKGTSDTWTPTPGSYEYILNTTGGVNWTSNFSMDVETLIVTDTIFPYFTLIENQTIVQNQTFSYDINAVDSYEFDCFSVNDTTNFQINCSGYLTNKTILIINNYHLNITINDTSNNINWTMFHLNVTEVIDSTPPYFIDLENQSIIENQTFSYDVNATDETLFANFSINWTDTFSINAITGVLTNSSALTVRTYLINVTINDTTGNENWTVMHLNVTAVIDSSPPYFTDIPANATSNYGSYWRGVDFNATDGLGNFDNFYVNDSRFFINSTGFLNRTQLSLVANYTLKISINDSDNNLNFTIFTLQIKGYLGGVDFETSNVSIRAQNGSNWVSFNNTILSSEDLYLYNLQNYFMFYPNNTLIGLTDINSNDGNKNLSLESNEKVCVFNQANVTEWLDRGDGDCDYPFSFAGDSDFYNKYVSHTLNYTLNLTTSISVRNCSIDYIEYYSVTGNERENYTSSDWTCSGGLLTFNDPITYEENNYAPNFSVSLPSEITSFSLNANNQSHKNMTPIGQDSNTPFLNVSSHSNFDISIWLKATNLHPCVTLYQANNSDRDSRRELNDTYSDILELDANSNSGIWFWVDYDNCQKGRNAFSFFMEGRYP